MQKHKTPTTQCLKFKTHSSIFLGRFEALNRSLIQKMMDIRPPSSAAAAPIASATLSAPHAQAAAVSPVLQGSNLPSTSNASTGGVKKKKGKKK
jgi:signal recognition particle subunit SRP9